MDNGIIQCPRCDTDNPVESDICYVCGESLHVQDPDKSGKYPLIGLLLLLLIGIGALVYYFKFTADVPLASAPEAVAPESTTPQKEQVEFADKSEPRPAAQRAAEPQAAKKKNPFPLGQIVIRDVTDKTITEITTPILAGGWVALPRRICLGGLQWKARMDSGEVFDIVDGIIGENDMLGLWRIQTDNPAVGPAFGPWSSEIALSWMSSKPDASPQAVKISSLDKQEHFVKAILSASIDEPGVLIQDDQVVGWTFGEIMEGAYLWVGEPGKSLEAVIRVDDFYRATFASSREEELTLALALGETYTQLERLAAMANSFRFEPKLLSDDTPAQLQPQSVIPKMKALIAQSVQDGFVVEVANIFDAQILIQAADIDLAIDVLNATVEGYDFEEATELAEDIADRIPLAGSQAKNQFAEFRSGLYRNWISAMLEQADIQGGWHAYELGSQRFPNDLELHLLGVRLALAENDWATAERLLEMREYPAALSDQVRILQAQISELKGQEGKIVIQFSPGTQFIPVAATLNDSVEQQFIVDTGASTVTIPSSTAERLGLTASSGNPLRRVSTANGIIEVPEVVLPSLKVNDWEVSNVTALIIDIPNQSDLGLLGLNFLERFRMDLNAEKGILILEPR